MYSKCLVLYPGDTLDCYPFKMTVCSSDTYVSMRHHIAAFLQSRRVTDVRHDSVRHYLTASSSSSSFGDDAAEFRKPSMMMGLSVWWAFTENRQPKVTDTMSGMVNELATRLLSGSGHTVYGPAVVSAYMGGLMHSHFVNLELEWLFPSPSLKRKKEVARQADEEKAGTSTLPMLPRLQDRLEESPPSLSRSTLVEPLSNSNNTASFVRIRTWAETISSMPREEEFVAANMGTALSTHNYAKDAEPEKQNEEKEKAQEQESKELFCVPPSPSSDDKEEERDPSPPEKKRERSNDEEEAEADPAPREDVAVAVTVIEQQQPPVCIEQAVTDVADVADAVPEDTPTRNRRRRQRVSRDEEALKESQKIIAQYNLRQRRTK